MASHFESWDLENIGVWQDEEDISKKQRKCQSSVKENGPSLLHINIMKLSLSVRRDFPQILEGTWRANGMWLRAARTSNLLQVAARSENSDLQLLPKLLRSSASIYKSITMASDWIHLKFKKSMYTMHPAWEKMGAKGSQTKSLNH